MGTRPKIRISADIDGREKQILAIQESGEEEVQVFIPHLRNYEHPTKGDMRIKEYRFSLHQSPGSTGNTITQSIVLGDATIVKSALFTYARRENLFAPVFLFRLSDLKESRFDLQKRAKDSIYVVPGLSSLYNNLIVGLVIGVSGSIFTPPPPFNKFVVSTRSWDLHVIYSYLWLPATKTSDIHVAATSLPLHDDRMQKQQISEGHQGSDHRKINDLLLQMLQGITDKFRLRYPIIPQSFAQFNLTATRGLHHADPYDARQHGA